MLASGLVAQNPFILDQFTADPSARVFDGKVYVYPSHDIPCTEGKGRIGWFCMEDYHVFSSGNLVDWVDHGVIVSQNNIPWVRPDNYAMWAPDCIERNGKYYFYFPTFPKDTTRIKGFTIGVAVASQPAGPYVPQPEPILNVNGIDPNVFIDHDGQPYLYWSQRHIYGAKLKDNMLELDSEPVILRELPDKGLKEGPYMFERNGIYYLTYPHVENKIERLEYAVGDNPLGPFKVTGVIMNESPTGCWTNHHSIIQFKDQWYLFYHHNDLSPKFDKNRSIRVDSLFFNEDGTIQQVIPTLRGVGVIPGSRQIEVDRYSAKSDKGASIAFVDSTQVFQGWKVVLEQKHGWVQFNGVHFERSARSVNVRAKSDAGGTIEIRLNGSDNPVIAKIKIPKDRNWRNLKVPVHHSKTGIHNLFITLQSDAKVEIDWISFE